MMTERGILRLSIAVTFIVAGFGILFGLLSGSFAIVFDGVYALADAGMTVVALLVANLIASSTASGTSRLRPDHDGFGVNQSKPINVIDSSNQARDSSEKPASTFSHPALTDRFTMGFWHLEPIVLLLNGVLLMGAAVYALINAIGSLMTGGRPLDFDLAIIYAVVTLVACFAMALFGRYANQRIRSDFLALDAKAWAMSGSITAALLIAFIVGYLIQGTQYQHLSPYIDPLVLALVCLVIIPIPIGTVRQALADVLLVTPADLKQEVDRVAQAIVARYGFLSHRAYVARVGRGRQIELYFVAPKGWPPKRLEDWDRIRDEIGLAIGGEGPDRWLTIAFTTDHEWAD